MSESKAVEPRTVENVRERHDEMSRWLKLLGPLLQREAYRALRMVHLDRQYLLDRVEIYEKDTETPT